MGQDKKTKNEKTTKQSYVYIIMEASLSYDDNYYSFTDGGNVKHTYLSKEKANKVCSELNVMARSEHEIENFYDAETWEDLPNFYNVVQMPLS